MRYHNITKDDMLNGDGLRVVLWLAGCEHHCPGCHNPVTWNAEGGLFFDEEAKAELLEILERDYISGITFSGGDPLHPANIREVTALAAEIKAKYPGKTIWLYTGEVWENICKEEIVQYLDVLVDGPFAEEKKNVKLLWKGSSNQRVVDVQASLKENRVILHCEDYEEGENHAQNSEIS
ncbi:MAG: anaerobic ribonucleoside-triphosphate reductase activating protein [Lachnospiraceae bacterium]|nr:anaerobic ribonucleoside-triphosphate reductase activating protein [Lachnospiraceae bacterium]